MRNKKLRPSDEAVVGIVVAVLLIGLTVSVVALVQTQYVPKWMKQKEAEHMEEVIDQFTRMKFAIDTQVATEIETPIATTITLGSKELPYLLSQRSFGQLDILTHDYSGCVFNITTNAKYYSIPIGTIKYSSSNAYYLDQSFIYEAGTIITSQIDGYDMTIKPSFLIKQNASKVILGLNLVNITGIGGKIQGSGYGSTAILTEYSQLLDNNTNPYVYENVSKIVITSNYPDEWQSYMDWLLDQMLDSYDEDSDDYEYNVTASGNDVTIDFNKIGNTENDPKLELKVHEIQAQLGPGWVE